ncbi:MAG: DUF4112 domain-containing protein [Nitrospiraceae bacterium]
MSASPLEIARFIAQLLDRQFVLPGTTIRVGLDPIIGLFPGFGDAIASFAGSMILFLAAQLQVPRIVLVRMGLNIAVNGLIGAIPIFGDLFSFWFKSNIRNVELLERYSTSPRRPSTISDWVFVVGVILGVLTLVVGLVVGIVWLLAWVWHTARP